MCWMALIGGFFSLYEQTFTVNSTSFWLSVVMDIVLIDPCSHQLREHNLIDAVFMPQGIVVGEHMIHKGYSKV